MENPEQTLGDGTLSTAIDFTQEPAQLSTQVIEIIAARTDQSPADLEPIYHHINPDALNALFTPLHDGSSRTGGHVSFVYGEYKVTVTSDGTIGLDPLQ